MIPYFNDLLKKSDIKVNDIDYIGVSVGPGSYTGVRVGYCFSIGLCQALDKKLIAVNVLECIYLYLNNFYGCEIIYPVINANNNNLYTFINGVVVKMNIFDFQKLLSIDSNRITIALLDDVLEKSFNEYNVRIVKISNVSEVMYYFVCKKIEENVFCDIHKYRIGYP